MQITSSCKIKLHTTPDQDSLLLEIVRAQRDAVNLVLRENFDGIKTSNVRQLHDENYRRMRDEFGLPSQNAVDVGREASAIFKTLWAHQRKEFSKPPEKRRDHFRHAPIRKSLTMQLRMGRNVTIFADSKLAGVTTLSGRVKNIPFTGSHVHIEMMRTGKMGDPKLSFDENKRRFYLIVPVTIEVPDNELTEVVAIDVGERHMAAVVSTAGRREVLDLPQNYSVVKNKLQRLRGRLKSKGTRSATRRFKRLARRERLFTTDCLHVMSKGIVTQHPKAVIVMEDLTDIRDNRKTHRGNGEARRRAEQWPFREFQQKVVHKHGLLNGGRVEFLDPAFTSQTCPKCGHVSAENRMGDVFCCLGCGHRDHSDLVAGDNLLMMFERVAVNRPEGASGPGDAPSSLAAGWSKPTASAVGS